MEIISTIFDHKGKIPKKYTCDGEDISPPLKISDISPEAETLAIVMDDPDAPGGVFDHWIIWNIPADTDEIPEKVPQQEKVTSLGGALQGENGFGEIGYRGPCPPGGPDHNYRFKVYALDTELDLKAGVLKTDLENEMEGKILDQDKIVGVYGR